ncbi:MAG: glycosyltransferase, partial [Bacteroidia bacterium]|nr:glycosyltransferase [Bacteroidia bacterium]
MDFATEQKPKMLMTASVASMIDLFNMDNIRLLLSGGYEIHVAANFQCGNITSRERVDHFKTQLSALGIKVFDIPIPRNIFAFRQIASSVRMFQKLYSENEYRMIHCHSPIGGVLARICAKKIREKNETKMIYTAHGFHFYKGASLWNWLTYYPIERYCSHYTDVLITINQEDFEFAKKHLCAEKNVYVQGVGVDLSRFETQTGKRNELREKLCIPEDAFTVITVGEINKNKNQKVIISAVAKLERNVHYILAGFGLKEQKLRRLAEKLGIAEKVHFLGFRQSAVNVEDQRAQPHVQPSTMLGRSLKSQNFAAWGRSSIGVLR